MAFSDLNMKVTSEFALQALHKRLAPITDFAHNFRELEDRKGAAIVIPTFDLSAAAEFNASTNNYFSGVNEVNAATVTLDKHYVKSCQWTDADEANTEVQFVKDYAIGIGDTLGRALYNQVVGLLNDTNVTATVSVDLSSMATFADLVAEAYAKDLDIGQTVLGLSPTYFAKLLGVLPSNVYGNTDPVQTGKVDGLFGFKSVVCMPGLPSTWKAAFIDANSIGVAARALTPMSGAYVESWKASDPVSNFPLTFRLATDLATGYRYIAGEFYAGCSIIRAKGLCSIK